MDMGNGVQYKERVTYSETRKGNVRVKSVQQVDFKKGDGQKTIKYWMAERHLVNGGHGYDHGHQKNWRHT